MATINQLVSEIAHSLQQPNSVPVRRAIKLAIIHARNELIRKGFNNHHITDKVIQQRFRVELIDVPDGDLANTANLGLITIKRSKNKVPRPTRLDHNLPFHSVRTVGVKNPIEIPFVKEASSKFYKHLPGMCHGVTYDYINEYVYINTTSESVISAIGNIIIESVFEYPHLIETETKDGVLDIDSVSDDDEFLLPEDMIGDIKKLVLETFNPNVIRETNEIPTPNLVRG